MRNQATYQELTDADPTTAAERRVGIAIAAEPLLKMSFHTAREGNQPQVSDVSY